MATPPEPETPIGADLDVYEEAAARIRELNERLIESAKAAGASTLDAYEKVLQNLLDLEKRLAGPLSWTGCPPSPRPTRRWSAIWLWPIRRRLASCSAEDRLATSSAPPPADSAPGGSRPRCCRLRSRCTGSRT
jgi:hypothetical protein